LEEAIVHYRRNTIRGALREGFARATADKELIEYAEWGMDDYQNLVGRS
jgi:hypothetical protein